MENYWITKFNVRKGFWRLLCFVFDAGIILSLAIRSFFGRRKVFVICGEYGRLGNRLFFFSHVIAWAKEHHAIVYYPSFHEYASWFKGTEEDHLVRYPKKKNRWLFNNSTFNRVFAHSLQRISLRFGQRLDAKLVRSIVLEEGGVDPCSQAFDEILARPGILFIRGFMFTSKKDHLIEQNRAVLQEFFTPPKRFETGIQEPFADLQGCCDVVVGVVIRHGDYKEYRGGEYYYPTTIFKRVLTDLTSWMEPTLPGFFIASDENQDTGVFGDLPIFFRPGHPVENLNALARCNYLLGSPSTFLTWPAFIGDIPCYQIFPKDLDQNKIPFPSFFREPTKAKLQA